MKRKTFYYVYCDDADARAKEFTHIDKARGFAISQSERTTEKDWLIKKLIVFKSKFSRSYITQEGKTKPSGVQRCSMEELQEYCDELDGKFAEQRKELKS